MQLTFHRGNYTGHWVEDPETDLSRASGCARSNLPFKNAISETYKLAWGGSGSLKILFKGKEEIVLVDKAEHAAEKVFTNYVEPDHHHLAEQIVDNFLQNDVPLSVGLKAVGKDERHIEHDVYVVRGIMKTLITNEGYDPSELSVFDFDDE